MFLSSIEPYLNISTPKKEQQNQKLITNEVEIRAKWFIGILFSESIKPKMPQTIPYSRDDILLLWTYTTDLLVCFDIHSTARVDFFLISAIHWTIIIGLLMVVAFYAFVYKSLGRGLDLLWIFVGLGTSFNHPRKIISLLLISLTILSYGYNACISVGIYRFLNLPEGEDAVRNGWKLWLPDNIRNYLLSVHHILPPISMKKINKMLDGKQVEDSMFKEIPLQFPIQGSKVPQIIKEMAGRKLAVLSPGNSDFTAHIGYKPVFVLDDYWCQKVHASSYIRFWNPITVRMWGFFAPALSQTIRTMIEGGFGDRLDRVRNTWQFVYEKLENLKITPSDGLEMPTGLTVYSTLGLFCVALIGVEMTVISGLLVAQFVAYVCLRYKSTTLVSLVIPQTEYLP